MVDGLESGEANFVPVEHDPLGNVDNAVLHLVESRKLGFDPIIRISHYYCFYMTTPNGL